MVGQTLFGEGSPQAHSWLAKQLHELKHTGPCAVLTEVRRLVTMHPDHPDLAAQLAYLEKRAAHMEYPAFAAAGWPIGDGAVESGNKRVVEARLKGSGMHRARNHVNPMLALRNVVCNDRWEEAWSQIVSTLRQQDRQRRVERLHRRRASAIASPQLPADPIPTPHAQQFTGPAPALDAQPTPSTSSDPPSPAILEPPWRPATNHPWRHMPIGRARFTHATRNTDAKP